MNFFDTVKKKYRIEAKNIEVSFEFLLEDSSFNKPQEAPVDANGELTVTVDAAVVPGEKGSYDHPGSSADVDGITLTYTDPKDQKEKKLDASVLTKRTRDLIEEEALEQAQNYEA